MDRYKDIADNGIILKDEEAYKNYIRNILLTQVGEVPSNRAFGSFLERYLFEPYDTRTEKLINMEVKRALTRWLRGVKIISISNYKDYNNQILYINVKLTAKGLPATIDTTVNINVNRGR